MKTYFEKIVNLIKNQVNADLTKLDGSEKSEKFFRNMILLYNAYIEEELIDQLGNIYDITIKSDLTECVKLGLTAQGIYEMVGNGLKYVVFDVSTGDLTPIPKKEAISIILSSLDNIVYNAMLHSVHRTEYKWLYERYFLSAIEN